MWYSRKMTLLCTLILLFLIVHLSNFWIKTRFTGIDQYGLDVENRENLFALMVQVFHSPLVVLIYLAGYFSLFWHLLHGFKTAFFSLGLDHLKYNEAIARVGIAFSIVISVLFALMPISIYLGWVK